MLQLGRGLFSILVLGLIVLVPVTLGHLPPVVASHFDGAGVPNGWSSRPTYALLLIAVGALLPLGTIGLVSLLVGRGPQLLNIPARDYWQRPEHGPEAVRRVRAYMWWLGCVMTATVLGVHWLILKARLPAATAEHPRHSGSAWRRAPRGRAVDRRLVPAAPAACSGQTVHRLTAEPTMMDTPDSVAGG